MTLDINGTLNLRGNLGGNLGGKRLGLALWGTEPVPAMVRHAQLAERIGFDSVWIIDSQLLCRDVMITLGAILAGTTRLRAATGVTQPITRHASVTAGAMATLAEISGNRAIMGIGTGFSSLGTIGLPQARIADVRSFVETVRRLLEGHTVAFGETEGRLSWLDQPVSVPITIAATGPRMTRVAAGIADGAIIHQGLSPDLLGRALGWLNEGSAQSGRVPGSVEVSCWAPYSLDHNPAVARDRVRARVAGALINARPDWFTGDERKAVEALQAGYVVSHHASAAPDHAAMVPDSLVARYAIVGDAAEVRAQLARLLSTPGIDQVILTPQVVGIGSRPLDDVLEELDREVLRQL